MAKVEVSPILADSIKTLRTQQGISSRSIAAAIGRSPSYFSKIESGSIKSIEKSELDRIFDEIARDNQSLNRQIDSLYATLKFKYSPEEIQRDLWFQNYDTVKRRIPIPPELIKDINRRMEQSRISIDYLVERINGNDDIPMECRIDPEFICNEWQAYEDESGAVFIKLAITVQQIEDILTEKVKASNYVTVLGMVYYLTKIEEYPDLRELPRDIWGELMDHVTGYLNSYKFYSLTEKEHLLALASSNEERQSLLTSFDKENADLINQMLGAFKLLSEVNVEFTNKQLSAFVPNLYWDYSFMLHLIGLPFSELDKISFALKQEMLTEIRKVVKKYQDIPDKEKGIETYT